MNNQTIEATREGNMEIKDRNIQLDSMLADDVVLEWLLRLEEEESSDSMEEIRLAS